VWWFPSNPARPWTAGARREPQRKAGDDDTDKDPTHHVQRGACIDEISRGPALTPDGIPTCTVASISAGGYAPASVATRSGEHRLIVAILDDAVSILVKNHAGGFVTHREVREARAWLASRDRSLPFGFESICDVLGLDPSYIRRGIRAARARPTTPPPLASWLVQPPASANVA
jgi:hypothetical protein